MTHERRPGRQPLLWTALFFSAGLWVGARAWRPATWWIAAVLAFALAALWFLRRRAWLAKGLSLGTWFLLGALLVQIQGAPEGDPRILEAADGSEVTITGHVVREGYARAGGPRSILRPIDIETENIERAGESAAIRGGVRLTISEAVEVEGIAGEARAASGERTLAAKAGVDMAAFAARLKSCPPENLPVAGVFPQALKRCATQDPSLQNPSTQNPSTQHLNVNPISPHSTGATYGTRLRVRARLHPARNYRNPGAFDYEGYLRENGIAVLGSARAPDVEQLPGFAGSRIERWRTRIHASIVAKIHELWPAQQAALMDAMVLGEDAFLEGGTRTEFQRSGTYHVLVVSGMNLSILAFVIFWTLRQFRLDPALASVITVVVSFGYAFVTGVGPPVWRAALMLTIYLGARFLYRERCMLNALGAAALGVLIFDPHALFGASFQLTFLSVLIIAAIGVPVLERTTLPSAQGLRLLRFTSYDLHVPAEVAQFRLDLRLIAGRLKRFIGDRLSLIIPGSLARITLAGCELLFISALMQAGLALPMAYYFHRATTMGMPANLAVVPLTEVLMPAAVAAVGLGYLSSWVARPAVWLSSFALNFITGTVHWLGGTRLADLRVATPTMTLILAALATLALTMLVVRRSRVLVFAALVALASVAVLVALVPPRPQVRPGVLEVTSIDVGQGDSILLVTPEGRTVLVDAGGLPQWMHSPFDIGEQVVSSYLWSRGIDHLDAVVITHDHSDHLGGMPSVIANFRPRELWLSTDAPNPELDPILEQAKRARMGISVRTEGEEFDYGGAHFHVLGPKRDEKRATLRPNLQSLVFTVTMAGTTALLEADAESAEERRIVEQHPEAQLLKVAHHGSASSTSSELLATVHPRYAVISAGVRNVYGHPRREVLERLQGAGVKTYRTDMTGAVSFYLDGKSVTPEAALIR
jgi:competence protein ComEC